MKTESGEVLDPVLSSGVVITVAGAPHPGPGTTSSRIGQSLLRHLIEKIIAVCAGLGTARKRLTCEHDHTFCESVVIGMYVLLQHVVEFTVVVVLIVSRAFVILYPKGISYQMEEICPK